AVLDRREHQVLGDAVAPDQLDHDVDVGAAHDLEGVAGDPRAPARERLRLLRLLVGDDADLDRPAGAARDLLLVARQHRPGAAADRADAEQPDLDRLHASFFAKWNDVTTMPSLK